MSNVHHNYKIFDQRQLCLIQCGFIFIPSDLCGDALVGYEIGKKEDRGGGGNFTTMADFLKVHAYTH